MEIKEYDCLPLSNAFSTYSTEIISSDNDMAVITRNGVHVMSILPNLTSTEEQFRIQRTTIKTPTEYIQKDLTIDTGQLNREKFCLLTLNSKFTPTLEKCIPAAVYVKYIAFANFNAKSPSRSILGILSNQGCLQLFSKCRYNWTKLLDISLLWKKYCKSKWSSEPSENDFEAMADKFRRIRIVAFACCTGLSFGEDNSWLLTCINENGTVSFWKVNNHISETSPTLVNTTELNIIVHTLHWYCVNDKIGWLVACCVNGSIKLYACEKNGHNEFKLTLTRDLWKDHDQILTTNMKIVKYSNRTILAFSKENCVLVFSLYNTEFMKYTYEFNKKVVGLEVLENCSIFVMLQNNEPVTLSFENKKYNCVSIPFNTKTIIKNHSCWGITFTRNKVFLALSMSIAKNYDHLVLREPWFILICCIKEQTSLPDMQNLVKELNVYDMYDYLEHFRFCSIKKKPRFEEVDLLDLWNYLNGDIELCRKMFQITYITSQFCEYSEDIKYPFVLEILFTICNFLYFAEKLKDTNSQYYFYQWLSSNLPKLPEFLLEYKHVRKVTENLDPLMDYGVEKCELCSSAISNHSHLKYVTCERGHKVLRCSLTFLPISTQTYTECSICHSLVLQLKDIHRCVTCDNKF